jgi:translation initiation factor IF-3
LIFDDSADIITPVTIDNNIRRNKVNFRSVRINQYIRAQELRVVDESGNQLGLLSLREALELAEKSGLDLVEISANAKPPVAKIIDWGKYQYQQTKQLQKAKKNSKQSEIKQIRFGLRISEHDIEVKKKKIYEFLDDGDKVKLTIIFRGREMAHKEIGFELVDKIIRILGEDAIIVDQKPQMLGKQINFIVRSKNAKIKNP